MGYLTDLKNVSAGHTTVTGPISFASLESPLEDLSNDTTHDVATKLKYTLPLTVDLKEPSDFILKTN
jgi:hypothetical protein